MKRRIFMLTTICCCSFTGLHAQWDIKENNVWAFGSGSGLDFNTSSPPALFQTAVTNQEGYASVCDTSGQLLFYTQGREVWNRNHQMMPNGSDLFPILSTRLAPYSGPQGALIVPVIGTTDRYYVFSLEATSNHRFQANGDSAVSRLWYSVVDMSLNGGLGDVDPAGKTTLIDSALSGNMIAVRGDACNTIWVLVHHTQDPVFKAYRITATGIDPQPVVSSTARLIAHEQAYRESNMRISPDNRTLARCSRGIGINGIGLELYDFDPATGVVSNARLIDERLGTTVAFSPDGSKLYAVGLHWPGPYYALFQFDVSLTNTSDIRDSRITIDSPSQWLDLRLAPDGKIYHICHDGTPMVGRQINCINDPNQSGLACNYTKNVIQFPTTGLPMMTQRFPNEYVRAMAAQDTIAIKSLDTVVCPDAAQIALEAPPGYTHYDWNDGATSANRTVTQPGTYWVQSYNLCDLRIDTFVVGHRSIVPAVITANGYMLTTTHPYSTYQWYRGGTRIDGATNATYTVIMNGNYTVKVTDNNGCTDSSAVYPVTNVSVHELQRAGNAVYIYPNPARTMVHIAASVPVHVSVSSLDGKVLLQQHNAKDIDIAMLPPGVYLLTVVDEHGRLRQMEKLIKE